MVVSQETILFDFSQDFQHKPWKTITDVVMGGYSSCNFKVLATGIACFSGNISLRNNGGFCTTRVALNETISNNSKGIKIKILGDGNKYSFRIKTSTDIDAIQYKKEFYTQEDKWLSIKLNFKDFEAVYRGKSVPNAPILQVEDIKEIGFLIANKQAGEFNLYTSSISVYE